MSSWREAYRHVSMDRKDIQLEYPGIDQTKTGRKCQGILLPHPVGGDFPDVFDSRSDAYDERFLPRVPVGSV